MAIYQDIQITVNQGLAMPDKSLYIFRGDSNIILNFKLVNPEYKLTKDSKDNLVTRFGVDNFELRLQLDKDYNRIIKGQMVENGVCSVLLTQNIIQQLRVGSYTYQITLIDANDNAIMTFPACNSKLNILDRLSLNAEEFVNATEAYASFCNADTAILAIADEEPGDILDDNGDYNKKVWVNGDLIMASDLNRLEWISYLNRQLLNEHTNALSTQNNQITNNASRLNELHQEIVDARQSGSNSYSKLGDRLNQVDSQLAQIENGVTDIVLNVKMFGVRGDGSNETQAIQNVIDNAPVGSTVLFPAGDSFKLDGLNITKSITIHSVGATLTQASAGGNFINITSNDVKIYGGRYVLNGGNGINVDGNNNSVSSIRVDGGEHGILIQGNNCVVEDCISENATYAGFKINFAGGDKRDCVTIRNCVSKNFKFKGIVYNGTVGTKKIIIEKFTGKTDTRETASDNILVDCGDDSIFCVDEVIVNDAFLYGGESNSIKIFNTNNAILTNIHARNGHTAYSKSSSFRIYSKKSYVKNIDVDNRIVTSSSIQIENLYASRGDLAIAHVLELNGSGTIATLNNINIDVNGITSVIRVDRNSEVNHKIILNNYYSSDKKLSIFGVYTAPPNPVGFIEIQDNKLLEDYKLTGVSARDNMIIRSPRTFISTTCPTSGKYIKGDIIYNSNIISGGNLGWICIQSKTDSSDPVFKAFGTIEN